MIPKPDWNRLLPRGDHRWNMGVRRGDAASFFAGCDSTGAVLGERASWLASDPEPYAALLSEAEPALLETVQLARALGAQVDAPADSYGQLLALGRAWEPDFAWMHPDGLGAHRLIGGVVCFPSSWALRDKLGKAMHDVHGPVPGLNPMLGRQIESLFAKQASGDVWLRDNVNFSRDGDLNHHPSRLLRKLDATVTPDEFWIRVERQLLLKLPRSGSILFGIRVDSYPLSNVMEDAPVAARLAEILFTMSPEAAAYKGVAAARPQVVSWLRQAASRS